MEQFYEYMDKFLSGTKPIWGMTVGGCSYVLFPDQAFFTAACAVGAAILLDIITKYVALSSQAGGYMKAVKDHSISSNKLWDGTKIKLFSYLVVAILAGLSYRVVQLEQLSIFFATVIYSIIFLREAQSILENLCDAGADLRWLVVWTKKKQEQILESETSNNETNNNESESKNSEGGI